MNFGFSCLLAYAALCGGPERALAEDPAGKILIVSGDVRIAKNSNDPGRATRPGDSIFKSDVIKTGNGGSAKLLFTDQSIMDLGPTTALLVANYALGDGENRVGVFSMLYGSLRALVTRKVGNDGKYEIRSSDAVMGVRGTEFLVEKPKGRAATSVTVVSGVVRVAPPNGGAAVQLGAGHAMVASTRNFSTVQAASRSVAGGQPAPNGVVAKVSAAELIVKLADSKTTDNTFSAAVDLSKAPGSAANTASAQTLAGLSALVSAAVAAAPPPPPPPVSAAQVAASAGLSVPTFGPSTASIQTAGALFRVNVGVH